MAIKVTLGEAKTQEKDFPKLMIRESGEIWYFVRSCYGLPLTGVYNLNSESLANWSNMEGFTDYTGAITLQNI